MPSDFDGDAPSATSDESNPPPPPPPVVPEADPGMSDVVFKSDDPPGESR